MSFEKDNIRLIQYEDLPYTMVGHTNVESSFTMTLTAKGLKKLIKDCHNEDLIHITTYADNKATRFEISKFIRKNIQTQEGGVAFLPTLKGLGIQPTIL